MRESLAQRAAFLAAIRAFFAKREVIEVDTSLLTRFGVTDVNLVSLQADDGFLITSPEYAMKRLLVAGSGDIYQLSHVFRGEEVGRKHLREFTLLEWYRLAWTDSALREEVATLVKTLLPFTQTWSVVHSTYAQLFQSHLQLDIFHADIHTLKACAQRHLPECANWVLTRDGWLDLLFTHQIEPKLGQNCLEFVCEYPPSQAALAQVFTNCQGQEVAARFELYIHGLELCNGFAELADAKEQAARFAADNAMREAQNLPIMPIDTEFLSALEKGLPACAGVALGVDRVLMLYMGKQNIAEVICAP